MSVQNSIDRLNSIKERIRTNLVAQGIAVPADAVLADMAEQILSVAGEPGISATHSWNGTTLTVTSASGTSSADLKGPPGDPATVTVDDELSEDSTNAIQNKVVTLALADKQTKTVSVEILETICENVIFNDNNPTYTLPSAITLDSNALYYIDCYYYEGSTSGTVDEKYSLHTFTRLSNGAVKWASNNDDKAIILGTTKITDNWRGSGHTTIISIYKVDIIQDEPLLIAAMHSTGCKTTAPGGYNANAEGHKTIALGYAAHSEGRETYALGDYSHVQGYGVVASSNYQHVEGKFNVEDVDGKFIHIVGNGTSDDDRSNAHTIDWSGNAWFAGEVSSKAFLTYGGVTVSGGGHHISIWTNGLEGDSDDSGNSVLWIDSNGEGYFTELHVGAPDNYNTVLDKSGGTMTGALTAQANTNYTTRQVRNVIYVQDGGTVPTTQNGDLVLFYK